MPNPANYSNQSDFMHACVPMREGEGHSVDSAVAACLNIWRESGKELDPEYKYEVPASVPNTAQPTPPPAAPLKSGKYDYRDFNVEVKALADGSDADVECIITTHSVDRDGDVVHPRGLNLKDYMANPVVLWAHDQSQPPVGVAKYMKVSDDAIIAGVKFAPRPEDHEGPWMPSIIKSLVKNQIIKGTSIGFRAVERRGATKKDLEFYGSTVRQVISKSELIEFSFVNCPSNQNALVTGLGKCVKDGLCTTDYVKSAFGVEVKTDEITKDEKLVWHTSGDDKVCEKCAALDGEEYTKDTLPELPHHPNCRCQVVTYGEYKALKAQEGLSLTKENDLEPQEGPDSPETEEPGETEEKPPVNCVAVSVELLIRLFEYVREDVKDDETIHFLTEAISKAHAEEGELSMEDYQDILECVNHMQSAEAVEKSYEEYPEKPEEGETGMFGNHTHKIKRDAERTEEAEGHDHAMPIGGNETGPASTEDGHVHTIPTGFIRAWEKPGAAELPEHQDPRDKPKAYKAEADVEITPEMIKNIIKMEIAKKRGKVWLPK